MALSRRFKTEDRFLFRPLLKLTETEAQIALLLIGRTRISFGTMQAAVYPYLVIERRPGKPALRTFIHTLRRKLKPLDLEIESLRDFGFQMSQRHRDQFRKLMIEQPKERDDERTDRPHGKGRLRRQRK